MSLKDKLGTLDFTKLTEVNFKLRPELLLMPQVPAPLHEVCPRAILGRKWWDEVRKAAYKSTDNHCLACGIHKMYAQGPKHIEAHEVYDFDYPNGRLTYVEAVPLCHYCHNFIHEGRMLELMKKKDYAVTKYNAIMIHGRAILKKAGLKKPPLYSGPTPPWSKWRLILDGKEYPPKYASAEERLRMMELITP